MPKHLWSPSFSLGLHSKKAVFDHTVTVQGVLLSSDVRSSVYETVQSAERLLALQAVPEL